MGRPVELFHWRVTYWEIVLKLVVLVLVLIIIVIEWPAAAVDRLHGGLSTAPRR